MGKEPSFIAQTNHEISIFWPSFPHISRPFGGCGVF